jgi:hypothetical protein
MGDAGKVQRMAAHLNHRGRSRGFLALVLLGLALGAGCEWSDVGDLALTWRFNGHAEETGNQPCEALGADRIVFELTGPTTVNEVVACSATNGEYPLGFLSSVVTLPTNVFARLALDVPTGDYDVRVFFIDAAGAPLADPPAQTTQITIERAEVARIDLDFAVTVGRIQARWRLDGSPVPCAALGAATIHLAVHEAGGTLVTESVLPCGQNTGASFPGLPEGTYELRGQLLDAEATPVTTEAVRSGVSVQVARSTAVNLELAWSDVTVPLAGTLRFALSFGADGVACSAVPGLANGPLDDLTLGLTDAEGQPVAATAFANPAGQADCAGLTGGRPLDGTTPGACLDDAQIVCGLQVGDYVLAVSAADASDLVCFSSDLPLTVGLAPDEAEPLTVLPPADATACFE